MHALIARSHKASTEHHRTRARGLLLILTLGSLAAAGIVLPLIWDVLGLINSLPKMQWLQSALRGMPVASWLLMFAWGLAVPLALLYALYHPHPHGWRNGLVVAAAMWLAVTWYVHMPDPGQCLALYSGADTACSLLRWGFSLSLGMATAAYLFLVFMLVLSVLGLLTEELAPEHVARE
ncbi:hypothetical protein [Comamonas composti]|uniref:hypothetical protein n=1 Tax=Comamonas composti TaxID=408558 RepID=UPI0004163477|nr:hypothetical protein [Comamonas composti]